MDFDNGTGRYRVFDGLSWSNMGPSLYLPLGTCTKNGKIDYDGLIPALKYCGNGQWRTFSVAATLNSCLTGGSWHLNNTGGYYEYCNGLVWVKMNAVTIPVAGL